MSKTIEELKILKERLELEMQTTIQNYKQQIHAIENELQLHTDTIATEENGGPQMPWNVEHEGIIRHSGEEIVHLFEREQVFENVHE